MQDNQDTAQFQHKVRVRVCGLLIENDRILLLKHEGIGKAGFLWSPPGGGVQFDESAKDALIREFKEEVNLIIKVEKYLFTNEYMDDRHHAIELFFHVSSSSKKPTIGHDPELSGAEQIITDVQFFSQPNLNKISSENKHSIFDHANQISALLELKGFYFFNNI